MYLRIKHYLLFIATLFIFSTHGHGQNKLQEDSLKIKKAYDFYAKFKYSTDKKDSALFMLKKAEDLLSLYEDKVMAGLRSRVFFQLGRQAYNRQDYNTSIKYLQSSAEIDPNYSDCKIGINSFNLASNYYAIDNNFNIDSFFQELLTVDRKEKDYICTFHIYANYAQFYHSINNFKKAKKHYLEVSKIDTTLWDTFNAFKALYGLSGLYYRERQLDSALIFAEKSLEQAKKMNGNDAVIRSKEAIGLVYSDQGKVLEAMNIYSEILPLVHQNNNVVTLHSVYCKLAALLIDQKEYDQAKHYYDEAIKVEQENKDLFSNMARRAVPYVNLALIFNKKKEYEKVLQLSTNVLEITKSNHDYYSMLQAHFYEGKAYKNLEKFEKAKSAFEKAIELSKKHLDLKAQLNADMEYSIFLLESSNKHKVNNKELNRAGQLCSNAYDYFKDTENIADKRSGLLCLYKFNKAKNNNLQALRYYENYIVLTDSVTNRENKKILENEALKFEFEKKEIIAQNEIDKLTTEKQLHQARLDKNRIFLMLVALAFITSLLGLFFLGYRFRQRRKLSESIKEKNKILSALNQETTEKNRILEGELKSKVMMLIDHQNINDLAQDKIKASNLTSKEKRELNRILTRENNSELISELEAQFVGLHEQFVKALSTRFPNLTPNNVKLCLLIKLNLSNKEIAQLRHVSYESVKVAQSRLRKKLGLGSEQRLSTFLNSILADSKTEDMTIEEINNEMI